MADESLKELELHTYGVMGVAEQADKCTQTTRAIREYVGRVFGQEMRELVGAGTESVPVAPVYPKTAKNEDRNDEQYGERSMMST